jgi:hypothetical protein
VIGSQFGESGGKRGSQVSMILLQPARKVQPDSISPPYFCCQSPLSTLTSPRATIHVSTVNNCLLYLSAYIWFIALGGTMNEGGRPYRIIYTPGNESGVACIEIRGVGALP